MSKTVPEDGLVFEELLLTINEYLTSTEEENSASEEEINNSDEDNNNSDEDNNENVHLFSIPLILQPPEVLEACHYITKVPSPRTVFWLQNLW